MNYQILSAALIFALLSLTQPVPQEIDQEILGVVVPQDREGARDKLLLSVSQQNYPVTPGDVYQLAYRSTGQEVFREVIVESDYTLNLNIFGTVNAKDKTFAELKTEVEQRLSKAYPNSLPFLKITSVGLFQVMIKGQIQETKFVSAWGLSRLSDLLKDNLKPFSSNRRVGIRSTDGALRHFDVFRAIHLGDIEENPFMKPGDVVIVYRRDREVEISGEVYRPGKYQLTNSENIADLVDKFGGGLTALANASQIKVERISDERPSAFFVDMSQGYDASLKLHDGDIVAIPSKKRDVPVIYIEGAIRGRSTQTLTDERVPLVLEENEFERARVFGRFVEPFRPGDRLSNKLRLLEPSFSPFADLKNGYIIRQHSAQPIVVDMQKLMYEYSREQDLKLQPFDRIVIPFIKLDVYVGGAVPTPGHYPFTPRKSYMYYVEAAGGIDTERNASQILTITDVDGKLKGVDKPIQPGDKIFVHLNNFIYNFNRWFPVITSGAALVITIITITNLLMN